MLNDEEKKAIDLLKNIDKQKCVMLECPVVKNNIERQLKIIELNRIIRKQSKEIEELKDKNKKLQDKAKELIYEKQQLTSALLDSTPNDKINAKIEEYENKIKKIRSKKLINEPEDTIIITRYAHYISVLQSLLEKE